MKVVILSGACKSGKSYLLKKVKKDLKASAVTIYDMDVLNYWEKSAQNNRVVCHQTLIMVSDDKQLIDRMISNIEGSEPWEQLVKQKTIELLSKRQNSLIINVLDRGNKNDKFYPLLSELFNITIRFIAIRPSYLRYCINLYKRKDNKSYLQTWGKRKSIDERKDLFTDVIVNSLFFGVRQARRDLVKLLKPK